MVQSDVWGLEGGCRNSRGRRGDKKCGKIDESFRNRVGQWAKTGAPRDDLERGIWLAERTTRGKKGEGVLRGGGGGIAATTALKGGRRIGDM